MASKVIKCLSCGSSLNVNKNVEQCKCSYCGSVNVLKNKEKEVITDVNKLLKKAARYEGNGNDGKAMQLYDEFLLLEPQNFLVLFARALISLIDSPDDNFNMELFQEYFDKGLQAMGDNKMQALDFLMYQFRKYTIPSMCVWQDYAYKKLYDIDKKTAKKRMASNMLLLFDIQNKIDELVETSHFEKLSKSYIEEYKNFKSSIINFGNDLLSYTKLYGLRYGFFAKMDIKDSIRTAKYKYKQFVKNHRNFK